MAWAVTRKLIHRGLAALLLGQLCVGSAESHSLSYKFTVQKSGPRQYSEIQGYLDEKPFLNYNSSHGKFYPVGLLGRKMMNASETWGKQNESLKDIRIHLQHKLLDIHRKSHTITESLILQATMTCQFEDDGHVHGSWHFNQNRGTEFHFDPGSRRWTENKPGSSWMKEWKDDKDLCKFLYKSSNADCKFWLKEFLVHGEKLLEKPLAHGEETLKPSAINPDTSRSKNTAIVSNLHVLLIILICSMVHVI